MSVSIIYVNYKTCDLILDSVRSVKEMTCDVDYEIIVVDNHSEDCSLERIKECYPEIICIQSFENMGFGRANNLGLEKVKGDYVLFLNPDTLLRNDAISVLYRFMEANPSVGACGGNLYDERGEPTTSFSRKFPSFVWEFLSIFYLPPLCFSYPKSKFFNKENIAIPVASVIGADLMVRRTVLDKLGGFSPDFFMNYEETELCHRIHKVGLGVYSVPTAQITHLEGRASYIKRSRLYYLYEGQYIYFRKVYGKFGARLIYVITQLKSYIRILQFVVLMNAKRHAYWKMKLETNKEVWRSEKIKRILR